MLLVCSGGQYNGKRNSIWYTLLLMLCLIFSNQWNSINRRSISNKYSNTCKTRVIKIICQWCTDNGKRNSEWYTLLLMLCVIFSNKHSINRRSTSNKLNSCRSHMLINLSMVILKVHRISLDWPYMFHRVGNRNVDIERDLYLTPISHTSRDSNSVWFLRPHSSCNQHANSFFPWSI